MKKVLLCFALVFSLSALRAADKSAPGPDQQKPLVIHEWGTFTSLQDENGNAIGGINTDDEPVPAFVHRLAYNLLLLPPTVEEPTMPDGRMILSQGIPNLHPDVTMRLETPVLYFHPPAGWKAQPVDVHVAFTGGWLTEFYPAAEARAPGLDAQHPDQVYSEKWNQTAGWVSKFGSLDPGSAGELLWKNLVLDAPGAGPQTTAKVWLAPRAVESAMVKGDTDETEKFLFYRGVAHSDAAVGLARNTKNNTLEIRDKRSFAITRPGGIRSSWLVDVRPDGTCAFRSVGPLDLGKNLPSQITTSVLPWIVLGTTRASFAPGDFSANNMVALRAEMHKALVREGLFADEADALLNTWQVSYFKSPGLRFFYLCPRVEIDTKLPLDISVPADVTRVMIGRIELVTPGQRTLLAKIAAGPAPDLSAARAAADKTHSEFFTHPENVANWNAVVTGKKPFSALGLAVPELYADYLKLGRFRNALVLDEQMRRPTKALNDFITGNNLQAYVTN